MNIHKAGVRGTPSNFIAEIAVYTGKFKWRQPPYSECVDYYTG